MKMKCGRTWADVGAVVFSGEGVDGILAEKTFFSRKRHGFAGGFGECDLIEADRAIDIKQNAAGVLTDGLGFVFCERDIFIDDPDRIGGE
jgi:hypothetical protein